MAYLTGFGDSPSGSWRQWLPGVCSLCRQSARAWGLCHYCHARVLACRPTGVPRCSRCDASLDASALAVGGMSCTDCTAHAPAFDQVLTAFDYEAPADLLIHQFKSRHQFFLAPVLARMLWHTWRQRATDPQLPAVLVAVPASPSALRRRGFNPAAELARYLAGHAGWHLDHGLLMRTREGHRQATLGRDARRAATAGLYRPVRRLSGRVVVVDDVMTTGSTMDSIARSLRQVGAGSVYGLALARTPPDRQAVQ